jgi:hypothetical protein
LVAYIVRCDSSLYPIYALATHRELAKMRPRRQ